MHLDAERETNEAFRETYMTTYVERKTQRVTKLCAKRISSKNNKPGVIPGLHDIQK